MLRVSIFGQRHSQLRRDVDGDWETQRTLPDGAAMRPNDHWRQDSRIGDAYQVVVALMHDEDTSLEDLQGAVEYLLDAIRECQVSGNGVA